MLGLMAAPEIVIAVPSEMPVLMPSSVVKIWFLAPIVLRFDVGAGPFARIVRSRIACEFVSQYGAAAIKRADNKGARFALLPGEVFAADQIERYVDDGIKDATVALLRPQLADAVVVGGIEIRESVCLAARARTAKEGTHQPVAIDAVHRKAVDVDLPSRRP